MPSCPQKTKTLSFSRRCSYRSSACAKGHIDTSRTIIKGNNYPCAIHDASKGSPVTSPPIQLICPISPPEELLSPCVTKKTFYTNRCPSKIIRVWGLPSNQTLSKVQYLEFDECRFWLMDQTKHINESRLLIRCQLFRATHGFF